MVLLVTMCIKIRFTVSLGYQISITKSQRIHCQLFFLFLGKYELMSFFSIDINFFVNKNTCKQLDDNFESHQFAIKISFND